MATAGEGLDEGIEWLRSSMLSISNNSHSGDNSDESSSSSLKSSSPATRLSRWLSSFSASSSSSSSTMPSKPPLEALHKIITDGEDSPLSSVEFLDDFERGIVARFDHRCHLRVGFLGECNHYGGVGGKQYSCRRWKHVMVIKREEKNVRNNDILISCNSKEMKQWQGDLRASVLSVV